MHSFPKMQEQQQYFDKAISKSNTFVFTLRGYIVAAEYIDGSQVTDAHVKTADEQSSEANAHHDGIKALVRKAKTLF